MTDVLTDRSPLDVARDAMPGYRDAQAALDAVLRYRPRYRDGSNVALVTEIVNTVSAGNPVPDDVGRRSFELANAARYAEAEMAVVNLAKGVLHDRVDTAYRSGVDTGIRALQPILSRILGEVRDLVPALAGVRDTEGAVAAGPSVFTAWHQVGVLADRYQTLRATWEQLLRASWGSHVELSPEERATARTSSGNMTTTRIIMVAGEMSNLDEVWPDWQTALRAPDPNQLMTGSLTTKPPWPGELRPGELRVPCNAPYLVWLATDPVVRPWLPTTGEARAAYVAQCAAAWQRQNDADEVTRYGRVRTMPERQAAASTAEREQIRRADEVAAWSSVEEEQA